MSRPLKYCMNLREGKHLRDKNPSSQYCSKCYPVMKAHFEKIANEWPDGMRGARALCGGSFHRSGGKPQFETGLRAFFHYVFPEMDREKAEKLVKEISDNGAGYDMVAQGGVIKHVKQ